MTAPVEAKVYGATIGGGAGATVSTFTLWLLGVTAWRVPASADLAGDAIAAVPLPVAGLVLLLLGVGGVFLGGWLARHTPRPALPEPVQADPEWDEDEDGSRDPDTNVASQETPMAEPEPSSWRITKSQETTVG